MTDLKNDRLIRALLRQPVDTTPVWIMRQAGRYLPEYRATRQRAGDFLTLCKTPDLACEVTMQPLQRYPLDAAILFSDILTIPDAMGLQLGFAEGEGPYFARPIRNRRDIRALPRPDPEQELRYVMDAVRTIARELNRELPLIGFSGSPWTLATYMVEGRSSREFSRIKALLYDEPEILSELLEHLADSVADYLNAQIAAGVNVVMLFDTWGGVLTPQDYINFSLNPMQRVLDQLLPEFEGHQIPVILFTKGGGAWLNQMADTGCTALGLDWTTHIGEARALVGDRVALQGNLDPSALYARPERIREAVQRILQQYGHGTGHVFNLGHGIHPQIDPDHVAELIHAVHDLGRQFHQ